MLTGQRKRTGIIAGDEVTLTYDWSLKHDKEAVSEQDINVEIPKSFTFDKGAEGEIKSADQVIGGYQVPAGGKTLTVKLKVQPRILLMPRGPSHCQLSLLQM